MLDGAPAETFIVLKDKDEGTSKDVGREGALRSLRPGLCLASGYDFSLLRLLRPL